MQNGRAAVCTVALIKRELVRWPRYWLYTTAIILRAFYQSPDDRRNRLRRIIYGIVTPGRLG